MYRFVPDRGIVYEFSSQGLGKKLNAQQFKKMKKLFCFLSIISLALFFFQCQDDEIVETPKGGEPKAQGDTIVVSGNITSSVTWITGNTYILEDMVAVTNNATLTIQPCVVVKGAAGATGLIIDRGAKIDAQGTATNPIIFTSVNDQLKPGEIVSPNLTGEDTGLWSGIFILGDAPVSSQNPQNVVPLLPQQPVYTYGGGVISDNSGTLKYVSIRHTGFETAPDETPCGLNLLGVGNGTTISHVELFANTDDGFLVAGGAVNASNIITSKFKDDGYDFDKGYSGTFDNIIGIGGNNNNFALELDGGENTTNPTFTIKNASFKGSQSGEDYIDFRQRVKCLIENAYFFGFDANSVVRLQQNADADNWIAGNINVTNLQFNTAHLAAGNTTIGAIFYDAGLNGNDAFTVRTPNAAIVTTPTTGANKSSFSGWTVADLTGALNGF